MANKPPRLSSGWRPRRLFARKWEFNDHSQPPFAWARLRPDHAAVQVYDAAHYGQAQPASFDLFDTDGGQPHESFEDALALVGWHSWPLILNRDAPAIQGYFRVKSDEAPAG
jgi:hypothetical protein